MTETQNNRGLNPGGKGKARAVMIDHFQNSSGAWLLSGAIPSGLPMSSRSNMFNHHPKIPTMKEGRGRERECNTLSHVDMPWRLHTHDLGWNLVTWSDIDSESPCAQLNIVYGITYYRRNNGYCFCISSVLIGLSGHPNIQA